MTSKARGQAAKPRVQRQDRTIQESVHDTYRVRGKLPDPTVCPDCGAVYHKGRWTWADRPAEAEEHRCPACSRTRDQYPAGSITLSGSYIDEHRDELLSQARNEEAAERATHPLARIIAVEERPDQLTITTTDLHLPRRIGDAIHHAHHGELKVDHEKQSYFVRVTWTR